MIFNLPIFTFTISQDWFLSVSNLLISTFTDVQYINIDFYRYPIHPYWFLSMSIILILTFTNIQFTISNIPIFTFVYIQYPETFKFLISDTDIHRYQLIRIWAVVEFTQYVESILWCSARYRQWDEIRPSYWRRLETQGERHLLCVPACVCEEAASVCAQSVAPYISSILEALAEKINEAFSEMQCTLRTQMDAAFTPEGGGAEEIKKVTSQSILDIDIQL